jgi:catechol 2,3-dioxygenase-like lactoylglutathione lyase family enzyme
MDIRVTSTVFQVFASDLTASLNFYGWLGLPVPDSDEPHVVVELPGGNTLAFDNQETIAEMHPGWSAPSSTSSRLALAFGVETPAEVDALFEKVTAAGSSGVRV